MTHYEKYSHMRGMQNRFAVRCKVYLAVIVYLQLAIIHVADPRESVLTHSHTGRKTFGGLPVHTERSRSGTAQCHLLLGTMTPRADYPDDHVATRATR